jgi:hypothetical protein
MIGIEVRRASREDLPGILELARRSLGWTDDTTEFLEWKHLQNPFGESPMWLAIDGERIVGFRAFLRWEFTAGADRIVRAVRAVDTATDPDYQGRGIFTLVTQTAIGELPALGIELIFNTPNEKSLPGYLKMGWVELGRLPVAVMPTSWRFPFAIATARRSAGRMPLPTTAGESAGDVFATGAVDEFLDDQPARHGLTTRRSREFLQWRYGNRDLDYRALVTYTGCAVFRRRWRGRAVEGVVCEVITRGGDQEAARRLVRRVGAEAGADYLIRVDERPFTVDPFIRIPSVGPVLACRGLGAAAAVPSLADFALGMGDVELF